MKKTILILLVASTVAYLGLCVGMYCSQRTLIYLPQPPLNVSANGTTSITLPVDGAKVEVTVKPHDSPNALIYFGGNAENVAHSLPGLAKAFPEHNLYLMNYRSYGESTGKPSEEALVKDAFALFDTVHAKQQNITIMGRSLGTGIAVHLASEKPASRLVLVTPYNSLQEVAEYQYPYIPVKWLLLDKYESWRYAPKVNMPTLILMAEHDEVIPKTNTELLNSNFKPGISTVKTLANTDHITITANPQYMALLKGG